MIELCPPIVHPVQTDFARAPSLPWRLQCPSSPGPIHLTQGWLCGFPTTPALDTPTTGLGVGRNIPAKMRFGRPNRLLAGQNCHLAGQNPEN